MMDNRSMGILTETMENETLDAMIPELAALEIKTLDTVNETLEYEEDTSYNSTEAWKNLTNNMENQAFENETTANTMNKMNDTEQLKIKDENRIWVKKLRMKSKSEINQCKAKRKSCEIDFEKCVAPVSVCIKHCSEKLEAETLSNYATHEGKESLYASFWSALTPFMEPGRIEFQCCSLIIQKVFF